MAEVATDESWHIPISRGDMTLRDALADMRRHGGRQADIPFLVQLIENPKYRLPGVEIFHGAVDLRTHDGIHLLLGRGMMPKDEAFVVGFTMGSTHRMHAGEGSVFSWIAQNLYPGVYRFGDDDIDIFRDAVRLGFVSGCEPLDRVDYGRYMDWRLRDIRRRIGLEEDLLLAYYRIERRRHPHSPESRRLLDGVDKAPNPILETA